MSVTKNKSLTEKIADYSISFFIYSVAIWLFNAISNWLVNSQSGFDGGILYGPYTPFYAFLIMGVMSIYNLIKKYGKKKEINPTPILLILISLTVFMIAENFGCVILEKITGEMPWSYSNKVLNINGKICWENTIFLIIFELICVYIVQPFFNKKFRRLWLSARIILAMTVVAVMVTDIICTFMK
ncbi:MAG: hypothetical protein E7415_03870 [Ruminococcaceae bacterium]|nr:hypothetical protein [Oscillospiraceae bacterium]